VIAGAFDSLNQNRASLFIAIESALDLGHKVQNSKLASGNSLFGEVDKIVVTEPKLPDIKNWNEKEQLAKEREVVGFYVSGHPLDNYDVESKSFANFQIGETEDITDIENVKACGVITGVRTKIDKSGKKMAFFTIDDLSGSCECLMFSKVYETFGRYVIEEEPVFVVGNLESSGDTVKMHVNKLLPLELARKELPQSIKIVVNKEKVLPEQLARLKNVLETNEGKIPIFLLLCTNGGRGELYSLNNYRVEISKNLFKKLTELFGEDSIQLLTK
jgi:DNA polymerase-3 subunit alpha